MFCSCHAFVASSFHFLSILFAAKKHGLDDCPPDVVSMVSHATAERLKNLLERLSVAAEHRLEIYKVHFVEVDHARSQTTNLKFADSLNTVIS